MIFVLHGRGHLSSVGIWCCLRLVQKQEYIDDFSLFIIMKTYKHKTLWWIAEIEDFNKPLCKYKTLDSDWIVIHRCFISSDSNREEVVEKDWVEMCVDEIFEYQRWRPWDEPDYVSIRKIIEKHAPQVKKFTREDIGKWSREITERPVIICSFVDALQEFLKEHNLLYNTD